MKVFLLVLGLAALGFAANDGCTETTIGVNPPAGSDDISLAVVNDWGVLPSGGKALGLDMFEGPGSYYVLGVNNTAMYIQAWDAASGTALGTLSLDAANAACFGVAWNNDTDTDTYYTDDWSDNVLYYTENFGTSWTTVANPAGSNGRGMDFDGDDYWITNGDGGGLWRFQPGVGQENLSIPEVPSQPSGVAVFPYGSNVGVVVTTYNTHNFYFYSYNGSTLDYIGSAACPSTCSSSYGLTYSETSGNLFWAFNNGGYRIAEVSFTITSLSRDTWAGIKTSF